MKPSWTLVERLDFGRRFAALLAEGWTEQEIAEAFRMSLIRMRRALRDVKSIERRTKT